MMKGKLMKSLFRGKGGVPRTPGGPVSNEGDEEDTGQGRMRLHSAEDSNFHSSNSLNESPNSESPRSWPSTFTTPMSYIKERKKRKASKFHIASPFDGDELKEKTKALQELSWKATQSVYQQGDSGSADAGDKKDEDKKEESIHIVNMRGPDRIKNEE